MLAQGRLREALEAVAKGRHVLPRGAASDYGEERTLLRPKGQTLVEMRRYAAAAVGLFATRTQIHEELARAWEGAGNANSARAHWARVAEGLKHADPAMAPRAAHARERAAAVR